MNNLLESGGRITDSHEGRLGSSNRHLPLGLGLLVVFSQNRRENMQKCN